MEVILKFFMAGSLLTILLSLRYVFFAIGNRDYGELFLLLIVLPVFSWVSAVMLFCIIVEDVCNYVNKHMK